MSVNEKKRLKALVSPLKVSQKKIFFDLYRTFLSKSDNADSKGEHVYAVVGERGSGKSTIMGILKKELNRSGKYRTTSLIDTANVPEDQGLMAAAVEDLWQRHQSFANKKDSWEEPMDQHVTINHNEQRNEDLNVFRNCYNLALASEKSFRDMAREMAMSPEQYNNFMYEWAHRIKQFSRAFEKFAAIVSQSFKKQRPTQPSLVIFLDDLDLAEPELVRNWARSFKKNVFKCSVFWILSFDRTRMVAALASRRIGFKHKRDLETGEAALAKIVPFHRQYELMPWTDRDKLDFRPFPIQENPRACDTDKTSKSEHPPILRKLIDDCHCEEYITLIPNYPRGLESIYSWLLANRSGQTQITVTDNGNDQEDSEGVAKRTNLSPTNLLKKFADANGVSRLSNHLRHMQAERIVLNFSWPKRTTVNDYLWSAIIRAINKNDPMRGLPVPDPLRDLVGNKRPVGHFETLCNVALKTGSIGPYQLLHELPFTRERLEKCRVSFQFAERIITKAFRAGREQMTRALVWGTWSDARDLNQWTLQLGPEHLIDVLCDYRRLEPVEMFKQLYLNDVYQTTCLSTVQNSLKEDRKSKADREPLLPRNLRALLLLTDSFSKAPWRELAAVRNFWNPITVSQCAAAFFLSALAYTIWVDKTILSALRDAESDSQGTDRAIGPGDDTQNGPYLYFPAESFAAVRQFDEARINRAYIGLIVALRCLVDKQPDEYGKSKPEQDAETSPFLILEMTAREALREMMRKLLGLTVVTELKQPDLTAI